MFEMPRPEEPFPSYVAFEDGRIAFRAGKQESDNPYIAKFFVFLGQTTWLERDWILGFREEKRKTQMELKNLGKQTPHVLQGADATLLERVPNPMTGDPSCNDVIIVTDEFTSLCEATSGPDFGEITIVYTPVKYIVESKSMKYYLESYRNEKMFHERIVSKIRDDLAALLEPMYLHVEGNFKPRGGLSIRPSATYNAPED